MEHIQFSVLKQRARKFKRSTKLYTILSVVTENLFSKSLLDGVAITENDRHYH